MLNPGGTPATTRFNNNQIRAAQLSMPHNAMAQASLRRMGNSGNPVGQPVSSNPIQNVMQSAGPVEIPTGGPQMPVEQTVGFDPGVFKDNVLEDLVNQVRTQKFINSPAVKDAMSSVTLRNFFNATNPNAVPDNRSLMRQVLARLRLGE
jgi:hypothetical protein